METIRVVIGIVAVVLSMAVLLMNITPGHFQRGCGCCGKVEYVAIGSCAPSKAVCGMCKNYSVGETFLLMLANLDASK
jgi:hypothetical protein